MHPKGARKAFLHRIKAGFSGETGKTGPAAIRGRAEKFLKLI